MHKVSQAIAVLALSICCCPPGWAQDWPTIPGPRIPIAQATFWPAQPAADALQLPLSFSPTETGATGPQENCLFTCPGENPPCGCLTMQILGGLYFSPDANDDHPRFYYAPTVLRGGGWWDCPIGPGGSWGRIEPLLEIQGSYVFSGPGNWFFGPSVLLRYNFALPGWPIIPYVQGGAGAVFSTDNDLIRSSGELIAQGGCGCRWWFRPNWSLDVEVQYNRITGRGDGIDALGGSLGATYYFR